MTTLPDLLTKITKLCEAATAGPWGISSQGEFGDLRIHRLAKGADTFGFAEVDNTSDGEFIIFARQALPLLAQVCAVLSKTVEDMDCTCGSEATDSDHSWRDGGCIKHECEARIAKLIQGAGEL